MTNQDEMSRLMAKLVGEQFRAIARRFPVAPLLPSLNPLDRIRSGWRAERRGDTIVLFNDEVSREITWLERAGG